MCQNRIKAYIFSMVVVVSMAVLGTILAGEGLDGWYQTLNKPVLDIPFWLFVVVQILYYIMCTMILARILRFVSDKKNQAVVISIFLVFLVTAELWNFFFIGLESTFNGFIGMVLFFIIAMILFLNLRKNETVSSYILLPYLFWLILDMIWIFELWRINR